MSSVASRLTRYAALAGVIPAASASAGVIGDANLDLQVGLGTINGFLNPQFVDFGPGFGQIFQFSAYVFTNQGPTFFGSFSQNYIAVSQVFRYDDTDLNVRASFIGGGGPFDPARLGSGAPISDGQVWSNMSNFFPFGTQHDIAGGYSLALYPLGGLGGTPVTVYSGSFGAWADPVDSVRGFIGFRISLDAGTTFHYGWFDVEASPLGLSMTVHAWALETDADVPLAAGEIPAPAPAGLLALALGAGGIRRARRRSVA
jgi:hypothetical protein